MQRRRHRFPALTVGACCQNVTSGVTARPNVELSGRRREGDLAAWRMIDSERHAAKAACRGLSAPVEVRLSGKVEEDLAETVNQRLALLSTRGTRSAAAPKQGAAWSR